MKENEQQSRTANTGDWFLGPKIMFEATRLITQGGEWMFSV